MTDRFHKSHPWRAVILRRFDQAIGALVVQGLQGETVREISPATTIPQEPGERMFKSRRDAIAIVAQWRADHGADICSDVFKVTP